MPLETGALDIEGWSSMEEAALSIQIIESNANPSNICRCVLRFLDGDLFDYVNSCFMDIIINRENVHTLHPVHNSNGCYEIYEMRNPRLFVAREQLSKTCSRGSQNPLHSTIPPLCLSCRQITKHLQPSVVSHSCWLQTRQCPRRVKLC